MRRALWLLPVVLACVCQRGDGGARSVVLWNVPAYIYDSDVLTIKVRVPIDEGRRVLILAAYDGDLEVRSSRENLTGQSLSEIHFDKWQLPAGELELVAALFNERGDRRLGTDHKLIIVRNRLAPDDTESP